MANILPWQKLAAARRSEKDKPTKAQEHVKAMRQYDPEYQFDPVTLHAQGKELEARAKDTRPVIKGPDAPADYLQRLKSFIKGSRHPQADYLKRKVKELEKGKSRKPTLSAADLEAGPEEPKRPSNFKVFRKLERKYSKLGMATPGKGPGHEQRVQDIRDRKEDWREGDDYAHSPEKFKIKASDKLKDVVNNPAFQALTRAKGGQKIIDRVVSGLFGGRKPRKDLEIKKSSDFFRSPLASVQSPSGFEVYGDEKPSLSKGVSPEMLERMKRNKLFQRSMDGQTKVVTDKKKNTLVDPSRSAKMVRKAGNLKAISSKDLGA